MLAWASYLRRSETKAREFPLVMCVGNSIPEANCSRHAQKDMRMDLGYGFLSFSSCVLVRVLRPMYARKWCYDSSEVSASGSELSLAAEGCRFGPQRPMVNKILFSFAAWGERMTCAGFSMCLLQVTFTFLWAWLDYAFRHLKRAYDRSDKHIVL